MTGRLRSTFLLEFIRVSSAFLKVFFHALPEEINRVHG
jgi:hypothetical protein